jgi:hypothetical protein
MLTHISPLSTLRLFVISSDRCTMAHWHQSLLSVGMWPCWIATEWHADLVSPFDYPQTVGDLASFVHNGMLTPHLWLLLGCMWSHLIGIQCLADIDCPLTTVRLYVILLESCWMACWLLSPFDTMQDVCALFELLQNHMLTLTWPLTTLREYVIVLGTSEWLADLVLLWLPSECMWSHLIGAEWLAHLIPTFNHP